MSTNNTPASKEEQDVIAAQKAVIDALGSSGQLIVDFVHVTIANKMKANAEELRKLMKNYDEHLKNYNEYIRSGEANQGDYITLLTSLRDALNVALGKHTAVATAVNDGKQVSPAEVKEATDATTAAHLLESDWLDWRKLVDQRLDALEGKDKVPTLAPAPVAEPNSEPKVVEPEPKVVTAEPNRPDQTVVAPPAQPVIIRYINPKTWGGMAWVMAAAGFIIFGLLALGIQGYFFPGVPAPMQWVRWLTLLMFPVFGLFAGGALGSSFEGSKETTVA